MKVTIQSSNISYSLIKLMKNHFIQKFYYLKNTSKGISNKTKLTINNELHVSENIYCISCNLKIQNAGNYLPEICLVDQFLGDSYAIDLTFVFDMT